MIANLYTKAYAVGYYYARSMGYVPTLNDLPSEDEAIQETQAFKDGFAAGELDVQEIDVAHQSMRSAKNKDEIL